MSEWERGYRDIRPGDSVMLAVVIGIAGSVITFVITLVIARAVDGATASWPAPVTVLDAILVWVFDRLHLLFAAIGFFVTGERVVATLVHDRNQVHHQANARLEVDLERERQETRRLKLENDIASAKLKAYLAKPAEAQKDLLISDRQTSHWTLTVSRGRVKHELDGRFVEAFARGLREGKPDLRDWLRREEKVAFQNQDYSMLRVLMEQGGVTSSRGGGGVGGVNHDQLNSLLDLWRTTRVARVYEAAALPLDQEHE